MDSNTRTHKVTTDQMDNGSGYCYWRLQWLWEFDPVLSSTPSHTNIEGVIHDLQTVLRRAMLDLVFGSPRADYEDYYFYCPTLLFPLLLSSQWSCWTCRRYKYWMKHSLHKFLSDQVLVLNARAYKNPNAAAGWNHKLNLVGWSTVNYCFTRTTLWFCCELAEERAVIVPERGLKFS